MQPREEAVILVCQAYVHLDDLPVTPEEVDYVMSRHRDFFRSYERAGSSSKNIAQALADTMGLKPKRVRQ